MTIVQQFLPVLDCIEHMSCQWRDITFQFCNSELIHCDQRKMLSSHKSFLYRNKKKDSSESDAHRAAIWKKVWWVLKEEVFTNFGSYFVTKYEMMFQLWSSKFELGVELWLHVLHISTTYLGCCCVPSVDSDYLQVHLHLPGSYWI